MERKRSPKNPLVNLFKKGYFFSSHSSREEDEGIFGASLEKATSLCGSVLPLGLCVPLLVHRCFAEIMKRGLDVEGIFRLSGSVPEIDRLQCEFDRAPDYGKSLDMNCLDIHAIAGVVKKYLRRLPVSVIPDLYHERFLKAADAHQSPSTIVQRLASLVQDLPKCHYALVHAIILLTSRILQHGDRNKMNPEALGIVFAPVCTGLDVLLLQNMPKSGKWDDFGPAMQKVMGQWTRIWSLMIENHTTLLQLWHEDTKKRLLSYQLGRNTVTSISPPTSPPPIATTMHIPPPLHACQSSHHGSSVPRPYHTLTAQWTKENAILETASHATTVADRDLQTTSPRYDVVVMRRRQAGYKKTRNQQPALRYLPIVMATKDDLDSYLDTRNRHAAMATTRRHQRPMSMVG